MIARHANVGITPSGLVAPMGKNPVREAAITSAIRARLINDKRVGDLPVTSVVVDRDVYLLGRVQTLEQRDIVEFIVRGTPGVGRVNTDELEVAELTGSPFIKM